MLRPIARTALGLAVLVLGAGAVAPAPAWAGPTVVTVTPADGSALAGDPGEVSVTFSAPLDPASTHLAVLGPDNAEVPAGQPRPDGTGGLRLPVTLAQAGDYTLAYHVVFTDGAELTGLSRFSVGTGVAPVPAGARIRALAQSVALGHDHGVDPVGATMLLLDAGVLVVVVLLLVRRPQLRRWRPEPAALDPTALDPTTLDPARQPD